MKNILVPIEMHSTTDSVLQTALLLGQRFDSYIEGVCLGLELPTPSDLDVSVHWALDDPNILSELAHEARQCFERFMAENNVPSRLDGHALLSYGFVGDRPWGDSQVATYARAFDLTILGRPGAERGNPRLLTAEAALFESGRPVLLAPPEPPKSLGETIVIAWNQSMESARATALAMPLLMRARKVIILVVEAHNVPGPSGEQLADTLARHQVPVEVVHRLGRKRSAGVAFLEDAASLGGDLMIKGAYTQSRIRQMIFGGATSHILAKAQMPVLMSN
ncbi:MAG TPA: universal stress protein [Beijerinckiaceae bacterium]|jgi:nucleotide-binding universal stress UspA family protein|nr:universal stress protein [Beijerinckiaceae bacterium]